MSKTARAATVADVFFPANTMLHRACIAVGFSVLVALSAQVAVRVPFTPVPVTGQTFAVLLAGALLGSRLGACALLLYLMEGAVGLPVFAGGSAGAWHLAGPTGGYLFGFVVAAFVVGWLAEHRWDRSFGRAILAMLAGEIAIYGLGLLWLARYVPAESLLPMGLTPFLLGDAAKLLLAAAAMPLGWKVLDVFGFLGSGGQQRV